MRPSTTTLLILPALTSSTNCEYGIGACEVDRVLNWLKTVISTRPMTSQITRFLTRLFKSTPRGRAARLGRADAPDSTPKPPGLRQGNLSQNPDDSYGFSRGPRASRYISLERLRDASGLRDTTRSKPARSRCKNAGNPAPWNALTRRLPPGFRCARPNSSASSHR